MYIYPLRRKRVALELLIKYITSELKALLLYLVLNYAILASLVLISSAISEAALNLRELSSINIISALVILIFTGWV